MIQSIRLHKLKNNLTLDGKDFKLSVVNLSNWSNEVSAENRDLYKRFYLPVGVVLDHRNSE